MIPLQCLLDLRAGIGEKSPTITLLLSIITGKTKATCIAFGDTSKRRTRLGGHYPPRGSMYSSSTMWLAGVAEVSLYDTIPCDYGEMIWLNRQGVEWTRSMDRRTRLRQGHVGPQDPNPQS